ncbi:SDR family NAD(P)-dependent oxidoreductase [Prauserella flavalba]|uniref:SDR family NAD(P)-dependent oxidoreductase n=1 Tax=Prauserella flavalba TaxID=1477506 RepID=UPI0036E7A85E
MPMNPAQRHVALVTGASRGIGAAISRRLAAADIAVVVNSLPEKPMVDAAHRLANEIREAGGEAEVCPADISRPADVDRMFSHFEKKLGSADIIVLNAAATGRLPWNEITEEEWKKVLSVNLTGAFLCCRRAFSGGDEGAGGSIIAISSVLAATGAPRSLHYATSKAGLVGFTRSLARELGHRGVRVNCVMPGAIRTEEELESFGDDAELEKQILDRQILQFRGEPDDVAGLVNYLAGEESTFITGQTFCVDGGWVLS